MASLFIMVGLFGQINKKMSNVELKPLLISKKTSEPSYSAPSNEDHHMTTGEYNQWIHDTVSEIEKQEEHDNGQFESPIIFGIAWFIAFVFTGTSITRHKLQSKNEKKGINEEKERTKG
jgi:hypothetical protein